MELLSAKGFDRKTIPLAKLEFLNALAHFEQAAFFQGQQDSEEGGEFLITFPAHEKKVWECFLEGLVSSGGHGKAFHFFPNIRVNKRLSSVCDRRPVLHIKDALREKGGL
jgi:hypothetical protein